MDRNELLAKLEDIEWEDLEFKSAENGLPKSIWETVSAFANSAGGWIFLGVSETKKNQFDVTGVKQASKIEQDFLNTLNAAEKFNCVIRPRAKKYKVQNKTLLGFYIPIAKNKPVYFNSLKNTYVRSGSGDRKASSEEIDALYREQAYGTKSSEFIEELSFEDLSSQTIDEYMGFMNRANPSIRYNQMSARDFLTKIRAISDKGVSYSALLFFGTKELADQYIGDFRIDLLEVPADSYSYAYPRYTFRLVEQENLWQYYFAMMHRIASHIELPFNMDNQGFNVGNHPQLIALREALVNMLMHADYFSPMKSRVRIFTNNIEFFNPGAFPKPIETLISEDVSLPRNPVLATLFRCIKLAENAGFGFDKMQDNWFAYNKTKPEFRGDIDFSVVDFQTGANKTTIKTNIKTSTKTSIKTSTKNERDLLELIKLNPDLTLELYAEKLGLSKGGVRYHLDKLKETGKIRYVGSKRSGYWEIIE